MFTCLSPCAGSAVLNDPFCELTNVYWERGIVLMIQSKTRLILLTNPVSQGKETGKQTAMQHAKYKQIILY